MHDAIVSFVLQIRGYGLTADAHHITSPRADGSGARRAMQHALDQVWCHRHGLVLFRLQLPPHSVYSVWLCPDSWLTPLLEPWAFLDHEDGTAASNVPV